MLLKYDLVPHGFICELVDTITASHTNFENVKWLPLALNIRLKNQKSPTSYGNVGIAQLPRNAI